MEEIKELLRLHFPVLGDPRLMDEIAQSGRYMSIPEGSQLIDFGQYIKTIPLVVQGAIKIMREDDDGGELFLYYLHPGQTCALSLNCCMGQRPSEIRAIAEEHTAFVAIPIEKMDEWMQAYPDWKAFVMQTYQQRMNELLQTIDSIAFKQLDQRLVEYLHSRAEASGQNELSLTHQEIATDLHSSREVISRLLKQLEKQGQIVLGRNKVMLK
ncbi:MAG: Crp/Fnr family transcriptional regulator [Flavobacteriales bacterium]|nr:Crp/Fnr family transcriptional regulator [Flavobacteriales bacterium]MCB9448300.1 Crp/Fnr family transcriptional regulator [Flavobacteriales bacterium]